MSPQTCKCQDQLFRNMLFAMTAFRLERKSWAGLVARACQKKWAPCHSKDFIKVRRASPTWGMFDSTGIPHHRCQEQSIRKHMMPALGPKKLFPVLLSVVTNNCCHKSLTSSCVPRPLHPCMLDLWRKILFGLADILLMPWLLLTPMRFSNIAHQSPCGCFSAFK